MAVSDSMAAPFRGMVMHKGKLQGVISWTGDNPGDGFFLMRVGDSRTEPGDAAAATRSTGSHGTTGDSPAASTDPAIPHPTAPDAALVLRIVIDGDGDMSTTDDITELLIEWSQNPFSGMPHDKGDDAVGGDWSAWQRLVNDSPDQIANLTHVGDWIDALAPLGDLGLDETSLIVSWGFEQPGDDMPPPAEFFG